MKDLFDFFPDLPPLPRKPIRERVRDVRKHAEAVRQQMKSTTAARKAAAGRAKARWKEKVGQRG